MHLGKVVFAQLMAHLPLTMFRRCVATHPGERKLQDYFCLDQFLAIALAQLTWRESLRDIQINLRAQARRLYHLGFRGRLISRNTLAYANAVRPWQIYADFSQRLIAKARPMYAEDPLRVDWNATVYALDSTTVDLCLWVFAWAPFRAQKAAIKLHTLLDLHGNIPSFIHASDGNMPDVNALDLIDFDVGAFYFFDRGYIDFARLFATEAQAFFVTRAKRNMKFQRRYSQPVDRVTTSTLWGQPGVHTGFYAKTDYPTVLRRVVVREPASGERVVFLTNNFSLSSDTIAALYRQRRQVELFYKWVKQHLKIKRFFGHNANAVKTQIWVAVAT